MVPAVRSETLFGALATPLVLAVLAGTAGLGPAGWLAGLVCGWVTTALLTRGLVRAGGAMHPADWVTLTRAVLGAGVAALVADSFLRHPPVAATVTLAAVALGLDAVDGQVARRTGTAWALGARFDMEVDAFLVLVLSAGLARDYGWWVLAIGAARYALLGATALLPWLAAPTPPRYWRKTVAAIQGIVLILGLSGLLDRPAGMLVVAFALALLAVSFGTQVRGLYRSAAGPGTHRVAGWIADVVAVGIVWAALVTPDRLDQQTPLALVRLPVELLAFLAVASLLPLRSGRVVAVVAGAVLGLLTVVKVLDAGFYQQLDRPFDPILDWGNFRPALGVLRDSIGNRATAIAVAAVLIMLAGAVTLVTVSTVRITAVTARRRRSALGATGALAVVWVACLALGVQFVPDAPVASSSTARLATAHVRDARATLRDERRFDAALRGTDPYAGVPASTLLNGLRGKDVVVAFVESYGQVAVQGTSFSPGVTSVLRSGTASLGASGYHARSAFLESPTFGGISWLAHSTLQSGLWIANQRRYDTLVRSSRFTLSRAFGKAGWRTVGDVPSNRAFWPQGKSFYRYDQLYGQHDVGYQGPKFSYASMPDQYTLAAFQRLELARGHRPVMAEIDLVSSHSPWTPLPRMVPWDQVGDGSIYDGMPRHGLRPSVAWQDSPTVRKLYGQSVQYSMQALISWVRQLHDDNLVLVLLGDHQPSITVSGPDAGHRVPISIVAHDPAVLRRISPWRWQEGLLPRPDAPVWRMDAFRDRFLTAFTAPPAGTAPVSTEPRRRTRR